MLRLWSELATGLKAFSISLALLSTRYVPMLAPCVRMHACTLWPDTICYLSPCVECEGKLCDDSAPSSVFANCITFVHDYYVLYRPR